MKKQITYYPIIDDKGNIIDVRLTLPQALNLVKELNKNTTVFHEAITHDTYAKLKFRVSIVVGHGSTIHLDSQFGDSLILNFKISSDGELIQHTMLPSPETLDLFNELSEKDIDKIKNHCQKYIYKSNKEFRKRSEC